VRRKRISRSMTSTPKPDTVTSVTREGLLISSPNRKIRTRVVIENGHYIIKTEEDITGFLEYNKNLGDSGQTRTFGAGHHVGRIPATLYYKKRKEFGGGFDSQDPEVKKKWIGF